MSGFIPVAVSHPERLAWLAIVPILSTGLYYALPLSLQEYLLVQFLPQIVAYLAMAFWVRLNDKIIHRIGLAKEQFQEGVQWGVPTGFVLGAMNTVVILWLYPWLGDDITFLRTTPHAKIPLVLMLPWVIVLIALAVEINFRGFMLGRLCVLCNAWSLGSAPIRSLLVVMIVALAFAFDPFMVSTFKQLHWIAVWDGIVWGMLYLWRRNLFVPIIAHALEVIITYSIVRFALE